MSRRDKLLRRFLKRPADFTGEEMAALLEGFGYQRIRTGRTAGSRLAFIHPATGHIIRLHRPHPGNALKPYQLELVEADLRSKGLIE